MNTARVNCQAGVYENSQGIRKMIVAGGETHGTVYLTSTEILNLDTFTWSPGNELPFILVHGTSVPFRNTFIVVGADDGITNDFKSIMEFDADTEQFFARSEEISREKTRVAAFLVPDNAVICN